MTASAIQSVLSAIQRAGKAGDFPCGRRRPHRQAPLMVSGRNTSFYKN